MKTVQRLSDIDALRRYNFYSGIDIPLSTTSSDINWASTDGTVISVIASRFYVSSFYVLELHSSGSQMVISLPINDYLTIDDAGQSFVFTCMGYSSSYDIDIDCRIYDKNNPIDNGFSRTLSAGKWLAGRSNVIVIDENYDETSTYDYTVELTITNFADANVYITMPNLVNDLVWKENPAMLNMVKYMPGFYVEYDGRESDPTYPMLRFIDVLTDTIADSMFLYSDWFKYDRNEIPADKSPNEVFTKSALTDYSVVSGKNREWLAQFVAAKIRQQIFVSGNPVINTNDVSDFIRSQLNPAIYGLGAGTQGAIKEAVSYVLTGDKKISIVQRADGDPWAIKIITLTSETPSSAAVLAVAELARPMGYSIEHESVASFGFILGDPVYGILGTGTL